MDELFPERIRLLKDERLLFADLREQCTRDLQRTGFDVSLTGQDLASLHTELVFFLSPLSEMERARLSYIADIPDAVLRAAEQSGSPGEIFAEAFLRREALKVITRIRYSE